MIREQYLINFGRCTKVPQSVFGAVYSSAQTVFVIRTKAYRRTYAVMDGSIESAEKVNRILSARKLALCSGCERVIRAGDNFCPICGHGQHGETRYADVQAIDR
jgi:hypothetical protein